MYLRNYLTNTMCFVKAISKFRETFIQIYYSEIIKYDSQNNKKRLRMAQKLNTYVALYLCTICLNK